MHGFSAMVDPDEPSSEDVELIQQCLQVGASRRKEVEAPPYDGIRGLPPEWTPAPDLARFRQARDRVLLDWKYTPEQAIAWMDEYANGDGDKPIPSKYPNGRALEFDLFWSTIGILAHLRWASHENVDDGLKYLAGIDAGRGYRIGQSARAGGVARAQTYEIEKGAVRQIAKEIKCNWAAPRPPSKRELAFRAIRQLKPEFTDEEVKKKADVVRRWL